MSRHKLAHIHTLNPLCDFPNACNCRNAILWIGKSEIDVRFEIANSCLNTHVRQLVSSTLL